MEYIQLSRRLRKILHKFVPNFWKHTLESVYIEALKREVPYVKHLNSDRNFINLLNGVLNLECLSLEDHSSEYQISIQVPITYNKEAKCPKFKKFLKDIFEGDMERILIVQEMFGYCLTADVSAQKAFFLYGKGANGKSILTEILLNLCGKENVSAIPLKELSSGFSRYEIVGKLLNLATENELSDKGLNTTHFKAIVAGEPIQVEKKMEQSFTFQPVCKLVFSLNNLPYSKDKSIGFQRRLLIIPFLKTFWEGSPETRNYNELRDSLLDELAGILNFALEGLKRLRENKYNFSHSEIVLKTLKEYKEIINPYHHFVDEVIEQGIKSDRIKNPDMINAFKVWCKANGHKGLPDSTHRIILQEIKDVLREEKIDFDSGEHCKSGGIRYTGKIKFKILNPTGKLIALAKKEEQNG